MRFVVFKIIPIFFVISLIAVIGLGEFVFWRVLKVTCEVNETILNNNPTSFVLDGKDQGPFRGERWNKWINKDLSKWYLNDQKFDAIKIENKEENLSLSAWWIGRNHPNEDRTIIIVHGINSSKKAREIAKYADGVVVGSDLIKQIEKGIENKSNIFNNVIGLVKKYSKAINK